LAIVRIKSDSTWNFLATTSGYTSVSRVEIYPRKIQLY
jgi:hypothetical protein